MISIEKENVKKIIEKYYKDSPLAYQKIITHGESVMQKALSISKKNTNFSIDLEFIKEAAMLHDIGVILTDAPKIGCFGKNPYIMHGVLGKEVLEKEGFSRHALVCERHVGAGITKKEIIDKKLNLPKRDMIPITTEEEIICIADKFFSKSDNKEKTIQEVQLEMQEYGEDSKSRINKLMKKYSLK